MKIELDTKFSIGERVTVKYRKANVTGTITAMNILARQKHRNDAPVGVEVTDYYGGFDTPFYCQNGAHFYEADINCLIEEITPERARELYRWMERQKGNYLEDRLSQEQRKKLEELPGWKEYIGGNIPQEDLNP